MTAAISPAGAHRYGLLPTPPAPECFSIPTRSSSCFSPSTLGGAFILARYRSELRGRVARARLALLLRMVELAPCSAAHRLDRVQLYCGRGDRPAWRQSGRQRLWPPVGARRGQPCRPWLLQIRRLSGGQRGGALRHRNAHGGDRPAARHLVFHVHADRVPGRHLPRSRALWRRSLCALRQLLPTSDRGADPAPSRNDAAVRGGDELSLQLRESCRGR